MASLCLSDAVEDALKLKFVKESMGKQYSFGKQVNLASDLHTAAEWVAARPANEVHMLGYAPQCCTVSPFVCRWTEFVNR